MRYSGALIVILVLSGFPVSGQDRTDPASSEGDLSLSIRNLNFIRNNEYSNPVIEGYTLIGFFLQPELVYRPDEKVILRLGAHLPSYSGTGRFINIKPVFSTSLHFSRTTCFTIGSLSGSDEHLMFDPHFNRERIYNAYHEDGLQLRSAGKHLFTDTWLSWENYIFKGDNEREVFTAGESFRYTSPVIAGSFTVELPVQIQLKHYGGQISNYPEHVETYLNIAGGGRITLNIGESKYGRTGFEGLIFNGNCITDNAPSGIENGYGGWYKLFYSYKGASIEAGYWSSHDFYAPNGNFIFSSVSDHNENLVISDRKIITGSININLSFKEFLNFHLEFDGYYDTDLRRFDNAMTLHLRFDKLIKIVSIRNP